MSTDPSSSNVPLGQQELVHQIVEHVRGKMVANAVPLDWTLIDLTWTLVGQDVELEIGVETADGPFLGWLDQPIGLPPGLEQLRDVVHAHGEGTWLTLHLLIPSAGEVSAQFGYERQQEHSYFETDAQSRAGVPVFGESDRNVVAEHQQQLVQRMVDEVAGTSAARTALRTPAEDFTPEPGMRYFKVTNPRAAGNEGYEIFSEVHDEGLECRKVQKFRDGRTERAGGFARTDHTWLNDDLIDLATLSADSNVRAAEISPSEFQAEWLAGDGW